MRERDLEKNRTVIAKFQSKCKLQPVLKLGNIIRYLQIVRLFNCSVFVIVTTNACVDSFVLNAVYFDVFHNDWIYCVHRRLLYNYPDILLNCGNYGCELIQMWTQWLQNNECKWHLSNWISSEFSLMTFFLNFVFILMYIFVCMCINTYIC